MNFKMANVFLLFGAVFLVVGFLMKFYKSSANKEINGDFAMTEKVLSSSNDVPSPLKSIDSVSTNIESISTNIPSKPNSKSSDNYEENKLKGDSFEKYVVQRFNQKFFSIMEWRSDKYVNGVYAVSNHFPDLEVLFKAGNIKDSFAIECKWRKSFFNNEIEWARDYQIKNYKKYAREVAVPVFIVIGIGGEPDNPDEIFIVPLDSVKNNVFTKSQLLQFKTYRKSFYWDEKEKALK